MNAVADALLTAIRSLPTGDKSRVISQLLNDAEGQEVVTRFVMERLNGNLCELPKTSAPELTKSTPVTDMPISAKEYGKLVRERWLDAVTQKGTRVEIVDVVWGKTPTGLLVGLPFATERRTNRWFLGLPESRIYEAIRTAKVAVVLLCQTKSGILLDFVLPPPTVIDLARRLSRSKGQVKFNVKRLGNRHYLSLPGPGPADIDLTDLKGDLSAFQNTNPPTPSVNTGSSANRGITLPGMIAQQQYNK